MHKLMTDAPGKEMLLLGNEAIARGALEAGVSFATCYPGTPSSEIPEQFFRISEETDLYFEYSTNEKVALEVGAGAAACGVRTMVTMKHVGLNVAADPLMTLAYVGVKGGMVIVNADDPSLFSSQNEQDNRYYARLSGLPMLEPTNTQEMKDVTAAAFDLSEALKLPVLLRTTTRLNHIRGGVKLGALKPGQDRELSEESLPFCDRPGGLPETSQAPAAEVRAGCREVGDLALQSDHRPGKMGNRGQRGELQLCERCRARPGAFR